MCLNPIWQSIGAIIFLAVFITLVWCVHDAGREEV
jgi:hypothetical protein